MKLVSSLKLTSNTPENGSLEHHCFRNKNQNNTCELYIAAPLFGKKHEGKNWKKESFLFLTTLPSNFQQARGRCWKCLLFVTGWLGWPGWLDWLHDDPPVLTKNPPGWWRCIILFWPSGIMVISLLYMHGHGSSGFLPSIGGGSFIISSINRAI